MATREQIAQALQAAHAAGNVEHARILAQAYRDLGDKQAITQPSTAAYSEFDKLPLGEKLLVGTGKGAADAITGITDLLGYSDTFNLGNHAEQDKIISKSTPGKIGEIAGNVAATLPTIFMPGANTLKGAALIGGGAGYLTNKGDHHERVDNALVGAAGGLLGASLPYGYNLAEKIFAPLGSRKSKEKIIGSVINNAAQDSAPDIEQRLLSSDELIPGSAPTAAEVAESGGISSLQRAMSAANPEAYTNRALEQSSARVNALRGIAKDETALNDAIIARSKAVEPYYQTIDQAILDIDPQLQSIMERMPKGTIEQAKEIARMEGRPFMLKPATNQASSGYSFVNPKPDRIYGGDIDTMKKAIDVVLAKDAKNVIDKNMGSASGSVKGALTSWADAQVPDYAIARKTFQEYSKPINQMEVGQELLNRLKPALSDYGSLGKETKNAYAKALKDVNGNLVKKSTGGISKGIVDVMTPEQMGILNNIAKDLARKENLEGLGRGVGSNTFQNFAMNGIAEAAGIPSAVSGLLQLIPPTRYAMNVGKAASSKLYEGAEKEMKAMMADALLDPKETARLMKLARQRGLLSGPRVDALPGLLGIGLANSLQ
jgi:hypothetical protein